MFTPNVCMYIFIDKTQISYFVVKNAKYVCPQFLHNEPRQHEYLF